MGVLRSSSNFRSPSSASPSKRMHTHRDPRYRRAISTPPQATSRLVRRGGTAYARGFGTTDRGPCVGTGSKGVKLAQPSYAGVFYTVRETLTGSWFRVWQTERTFR
jgi:hypothetical protein